MYCAECGIEGKKAASFCARCGRPLISREKPEVQSMHCPQCGKIYGADYQFCAEDGSKLQPQEAIVIPSQALPPKVKTSPILTIVLLFLSIFLIIVLAAGGYLYFSGRWTNIPVIAKLLTPPSTQRSYAKKEPTVNVKEMKDIFQQLLLDCKASAPSPKSWDEIKMDEPANKYVEIKIVPLAKGRITYLVRGIKHPFFGARTEMYWIYERTESGYREVADLGANDDVRTSKSKHNGYRDILTMGIVGAGTEAIICKHIFNGRKYVNAGCKSEKLK
jgi:hypothetical protein